MIRVLLYVCLSLSLSNSHFTTNDFVINKKKMNMDSDTTNYKDSYRVKLKQKLRGLTENIGVLTWAIIIGAALILLTAILAIVLVARASSVTVISSTSSTCGTPKACVVRQLESVGGSTARCVEHPEQYGVSCSDNCVSDGYCSGYSYNVNETDRTEPFCVPKEYTSCRGSCASFTDCPDIELITGVFSSFAVCYSGSCLYGVPILDFSSIQTLNTLLLPTESDVFKFGAEAQACSWVLDDSEKQRSCLDYTIVYDSFVGIYDCFYQFKCARPNYLGSSTNYIITSVPSSNNNTTNQNNTNATSGSGGVNTTSLSKSTVAIKSKISGYETKTLSVDPDLEVYFKDVKDVKGLKKAMITVSQVISRKEDKKRR